jgi:hypothetical protein
MYSDTWPSVRGRLGLFHFVQRIMRTLRKSRVDYFRAVNSLLSAVYFYNTEDYEALLQALKGGTISNTKFTDDDIAYMKSTKMFRQRYDKYLRKEIRPPHSLRAKLDDWFDCFKCSNSSESSRPALGRIDPKTQQSLFTVETKVAWSNCKEKAEYLQDPLPLDEMYYVILPNPNSPHGLKEYLSRHGESCLEAYHLLLAHFANCGMRSSLADNLNLTGTCRYNISIRHRLRLASLSADNNSAVRRKMPAPWETVVPYFNHSELHWVNQLARKTGVQKVPFVSVKALPEDNGERFFSEYLQWMKVATPKFDAQDQCLCLQCEATPSLTLQAFALPPMDKSPNDSTATTSPQLCDMPTTPAQETTIVENVADVSTNYVTTNLTRGDPHSIVQAPTPQQQQQQQPTQQMMFPRHVQYPFFTFAPPLHTWPTIPPTNIGNTTQPIVYCCLRYRQWHNNVARRGQPPHEFHCENYGKGKIKSK